jgi:hypothetical protein
MCKFLWICLCIPALSLAQQPAKLAARLVGAPDNEKLKIYLSLSQAYMEQQPDSAVHYANEGMRLSEKRNDQSAQAMLLLQLIAG